MLAKDHKALYDISRWFMTQFKNSASACFLYGTLFSHGLGDLHAFGEASSQKYLARQLRGGETVPLLVLHGHIFSVSRSYSHALRCYGRAWNLEPKNPLVNLFVGITLLHRATQRNTDNRHRNVMEGFAFLFQYRKLVMLASEANEAEAVADEETKERKRLLCKQETAYNLGRAFHMVSLFPYAIRFYEEALLVSDQLTASMISRDQMQVDKADADVDANADAEEKKQEPYPIDLYDLKRETAYNLSQIYIQCGSPVKAKQVLCTYYVV